MRIILVTGGNRGIGLEICRQLESLGHTVIMGSRHLEKGQEAAEAFCKNVVVQQLDVTDELSIIRLYAFIHENYGRLDVLINNAGIGESIQSGAQTTTVRIREIMVRKCSGIWKIARTTVPFMRRTGIIARNDKAETVSIDKVKLLYDTNLFGSWRMIQAFIPLLEKSEKGQIINISSGSGSLNALSGSYPAYSMSKASLNALTLMFSNELKGKGISVNAMCPGWVKTDMGGPLAPLQAWQGADTAVWLADSEDLPTGKFFKNREEIGW